jgi:hypothetical protein
MLTPGTSVVSIGADQFSVTGLTEVRSFFSLQYLNVGFLMWRAGRARWKGVSLENTKHHAARRLGMHPSNVFVFAMGSNATDQVSKLEVTVLFMKTKASNTQKPPPTPSHVSESLHANAQQVTGAAAAATDEVAGRGPPQPLAAAKPTEPDSPFEIGISASQLLEYCKCVLRCCIPRSQTHSL